MCAVVIAAVAAGLGVAMPLGPVGLLLLSEGMKRGRRPALVAASAIALVDLLSCAVAVVAGATLAPVVRGWGFVPGVISGIVVVALGVRQLIGSVRAVRAPSDATAVSQGAVFVRFVVLTATNPLTLVYFFALSGALGDSAGHPVVFVLIVGLTSFLWQAGLGLIGSMLRAVLPRGVVIAVNVLAAVVVIVLGATVVGSALAAAH